MRRIAELLKTYLPPAMFLTLVLIGFAATIYLDHEQQVETERLQVENQRLNDIYQWRLEQVEKLRAENDELRELVGDVPEWRGREYYLQD